MSTWFKKTIVFILTMLIGASAVVACNTVKGVGKDLEQGGQALQDAATK